MKKPTRTKSKLLWVAAQDLRIHPRAQRELLPSRLNKLMADLDLDSIGVIHAVQYDIDGETSLWVIDGQHRIRALLEHDLGDWEVEVKVHLDCEDDARACELFLKLNDRAAVAAFDKYEKALRAGYSDAVGVDKILRERQLQVARKTADSTLSCVVTLRKLFQYDGGAALENTLDTIISAWGRVSSACEGKLIEGLGKVYRNYNGTIDKTAMAKKLSKYAGGASGLLGDAKGMLQYRHGTLGRSVALQIVDVYNQGRATKLDPL